MNIEDEDFRNIPDAKYSSKPISSKNPRAKSSRKKSNKPKDYYNYDDDILISDDSFKPSNKRGKKKRKGVFGGILFTAIVLGVSIILSVVIVQSAQDYLGLFKESKMVEIEIPEKASTREISNLLKKSNVIRHPFTFQLYAKLRKMDDKYKKGESFFIDTNYSYDQLNSVLTGGGKNSETVQVTIVEGMTAREIANLLEENNVCLASEFLETLNNIEPIYEWQKEISDSNDRYFKYEGYLFPNTHTFYVGEKPESVINRFFKDFDNKLSKEELEKIEQMGMTVDEVITLASLIQKEASGLDEMMFKVSAVFHNRLADQSQYPKLQSDVTIDYVNKNIKNYVESGSTLERYAEAYNTYKKDGLPVGPICNPGKVAIQAAIYPDIDDESMKGVYFFVTDVLDQFYYADTYEKHLKNISKAFAVKDDGKNSKVGGLATER